MPFMCLTCDQRPVYNESSAAIEHMMKNPFHQMVYYDDKSINGALEKVKKQTETIT